LIHFVSRTSLPAPHQPAIPEHPSRPRPGGYATLRSVWLSHPSTLQRPSLPTENLVTLPPPGLGREGGGEGFLRNDRDNNNGGDLGGQAYHPYSCVPQLGLPSATFPPWPTAGREG